MIVTIFHQLIGTVFIYFLSMLRFNVDLSVGCDHIFQSDAHGTILGKSSWNMNVILTFYRNFEKVSSNLKGTRYPIAIGSVGSSKGSSLVESEINASNFILD